MAPGTSTSITTPGSSRASRSAPRLSNDHEDLDETQDTGGPSAAPMLPTGSELLEKKYDSGGRLILYISSHGLLSPTSDVRRTSTGIFQGYLVPEGVNWESLPIPRREFYWSEFQNYCNLDQNRLNKAVVKKLWFKQAKVAYRDLVSRVKRDILINNKTPGFVKDDILSAWKAFWDTPAAKAKAAQASKNRCSEPGGPGTGKVVHFGGSRNAERIAQDLAKAGNLPVGLVSYRVMKKMHYKNGVYTDGRSQMIIEEVERMIAEARHPLPGTTQSRQVTAEMENAFYAKVVKLDSRGRRFGQGCMSQGIRESSYSASVSQTQTPVPDPQVSELKSRLEQLEKSLVPRMDLIQSALEEHMRIYRPHSFSSRAP